MEASSKIPPYTPMILSKINLWSALSSCSSSEENYSRTDMNTCKPLVQKNFHENVLNDLIDRPLVQKSVEEGQGNILDDLNDRPLVQKSVEEVQGNILDDLNDRSFVQKSVEVVQETILDDFNDRPSSGGYINESTHWDVSSSCEKKTPVFPKFSFECGSASSLNKSRFYSWADKRKKRRLFSSSTLSDSPVLSEESEMLSCCRSKYPPPPPERYDSLYVSISEEKELRGAPWFQAGIPREIALEVLNHEPIGSFMVRESTSKPGCFALSLRVPREFHPSGIAHYLIMRTNRGYKIKGFTKEFGSLSALITHHSVMPELLPCPLSLSRYNPSFPRQDSQDMADIDYNLLSDFRKLLADINV